MYVSLFLIKLRSSYKYCEIFKNTYFEEHLQTADSGHLAPNVLKGTSTVI